MEAQEPDVAATPYATHLDLQGQAGQDASEREICVQIGDPCSVSKLVTQLSQCVYSVCKWRSFASWEVLAGLTKQLVETAECERLDSGDPKMAYLVPGQFNHLL